MAKVLGIDYGDRRIGLAITDEDRRYSFALKTLDNKNQAQYLSELKEICDQESVDEIVIGLPLNQEGEEGPAAIKVKQFAESLKEATGVNCSFIDERFTTVMATKLHQEAGKKAKKTKDIIDQDSAVIILQTFLDKSNG